MATLGEEAKAYVPKETKNIADLEVVKTDSEILRKEAIDKDGKTFTYSYIVVQAEEFRVPNSVLKSLKVILEYKPNLKAFQVKKSGTGFNTEYTVIPLS